MLPKEFLLSFLFQTPNLLHDEFEEEVWSVDLCKVWHFAYVHIKGCVIRVFDTQRFFLATS